MRKTFALIAKGLLEKEELLQKSPAGYPYSRTLQHGMGMFLAASQQAGDRNAIQYADEAAFLSHFVTRPVAEWFEGWQPEILDSWRIREQAFYGYDAFAYRRAGNVYVPSSDCCEFLETQDDDIMEGTDEHILYETMRTFGQEDYGLLRRYIIEHPIITLEERRMMSLELADRPAVREAFQFAYEEVAGGCYRCPKCGWTMTRGKYGYSCHATHCTDTVPELTEEMKLDLSAGSFYRLKKGVMRYIAAPGRWELAIATFCEKKKLNWTLWPQMDTYDIEIQFPDGEVWETDAKAYRNPVTLRAQIQSKGGFPKGEYARGYYVIPDEYTAGQRNYTAVVNRALGGQTNVKCITFRTLKREIARKEAACREK